MKVDGVEKKINNSTTSIPFLTTRILNLTAKPPSRKTALPRSISHEQGWSACHCRKPFEGGEIQKKWARLEHFSARQNAARNNL